MQIAMNDPFVKEVSLRWADLDPNFHLRHSVYYDFGAQQRIEILHHLGLTPQVMQEQAFGPVIFREECVFRKEIRFAQNVRITATMARLKSDGSRWTIRHQFVDDDNKLLAILTVDGAWMNTALRKLASPTPKVVVDVLDAFPKSDDFSEAAR